MAPRGLPPATELRRVVVLSSPYKPEAHPCARKVAALFEARGVETVLDLEGGESARAAAREADLVVSVGGDGTILGTARRLAGLLVPTIGINIGKLGFLAEFDLRDIEAYLEGDTGRFRVVPRLMLECRCGTGPPMVALNDVVITQGPLARLLSIDMDVDGQRATRYAADGIVVSTPVGSTAYSLSLGGPLLTPGAEALIVTPIAPHMLTNRSLVLEAESELRFHVERKVPELALVVDGQELVPLDRDEPIVVRRAPHPFLLAAHRDRTFFDLLRLKLYWTRTSHSQRVAAAPGLDAVVRSPVAVVYLHGLLSGPGSRKGRHVAQRLRGRGVVVELADLHGSDGLERMEVGRMLARAREAVARARRLAGIGERGPVVLVGSSLGGWIASLLATEDEGIAGLLLLAPAFDFVRRLAQHCGRDPDDEAAAAEPCVVTLPGGERRTIGPAFCLHGRHYEPFPAAPCPTVIVHGRHDALVPEEVVRSFARDRPQVRLVVVDDDHGLHGSLEVIDAELDALLVQIAATLGRADAGQGSGVA